METAEEDKMTEMAGVEWLYSFVSQEVIGSGVQQSMEEPGSKYSLTKKRVRQITMQAIERMQTGECFHLLRVY